MYKALLKEMAAQAKEYGTGLQPPCPMSSVEALKLRARDELSIDLPDDYLTFLKQNNGFDLNGLLIYASERLAVPGSDDEFVEGIVEANLARRDYEPMKQYIVFGEAGDDTYVYSISDNEYQVIDTVSMDVLERFPTFDELITRALESHL